MCILTHLAALRTVSRCVRTRTRAHARTRVHVCIAAAADDAEGRFLASERASEPSNAGEMNRRELPP